MPDPYIIFNRLNSKQDYDKDYAWEDEDKEAEDDEDFSST